MSYQSMVAMASSPSLQTRCAAAAAQVGLRENPVVWVQQVIWRIVAEDPAWADAWDAATAIPNPNVNPDTGQRNDVISDDMILTVVSPMIVLPEQQEGAEGDGSQGAVG